MDNARIKNQLGKELNEAIRGLEKDIYKSWREIENTETREKHIIEIFRFIHDLFFARTI